ncbi:Radical SAM domain protein [Methanococcus vannielii SB]|uniref:Radical SAM domain protein n=1 Tax=Methanococcus vannielii (strain ATCC 35089 / DSM 1224 / JCM 13029 / OCM 148 / SB) TaxID=406327 RepID=A6UQS4_METVS|nr:radical SAM protein [Methanococcus vannielii]ABR54846.1 Radical SAM domain protein [Methanococcus vannielii SB]
MKITLRNPICDELENIVKDLKVIKHCIGCEGLNLKNDDPHHHPTIEITTECNHDCIFCYSKLTSVKAGLYGDLEKFKAVTISQYGEPLIYPEKVKNAIKFVKSKNLRCDLQTNGSLLTESLLKEFKELGLDILMISLSSDNKKSHSILSKEVNFDKILENVKISSNYFHTIVRSVYIPGFNDDELVNLGRILNETNVKEMMIHQLVIHPENLKELETTGNLNEVGKIKDLLLLIQKIKNVAPNLNVTIKGCLLVYLKTMDGFILNSINSDCISEVPTIKREYNPILF